MNPQLQRDVDSDDSSRTPALYLLFHCAYLHVIVDLEPRVAVSRSMWEYPRPAAIDVKWLYSTLNMPSYTLGRRMSRIDGTSVWRVTRSPINN